MENRTRDHNKHLKAGCFLSWKVTGSRNLPKPGNRPRRLFQMCRTKVCDDPNQQKLPCPGSVLQDTCRYVTHKTFSLRARYQTRSVVHSTTANIARSPGHSCSLFACKLRTSDSGGCLCRDLQLDENSYFSKGSTETQQKQTEQLDAWWEM